MPGPGGGGAGTYWGRFGRSACRFTRPRCRRGRHRVRTGPGRAGRPRRGHPLARSGGRPCSWGSQELFPCKFELHGLFFQPIAGRPTEFQRALLDEPDVWAPATRSRWRRLDRVRRRRRLRRSLRRDLVQHGELLLLERHLDLPRRGLDQHHELGRSSAFGAVLDGAGLRQRRWVRARVGGQAATNCNGSAYCTDTWRFSGGKWTELTPSCYLLGKSGSVSCSTSQLTDGPGNLPGAQLVNDPANGYVLLATSGGNNSRDGGAGTGVWTYRAGSWTDWNYNWSSHTVLQTPRFGGIAYDAADGFVVAFGNSGDHLGYVSPNYPYYPPTSTTWEWANGTWVNLTATAGTPPSARYDPSMAYDSTDGFLVLYGGYSYTCTTYVLDQCTAGFANIEFNDTWGFSGGRWTNLSEGIANGVRTDFVGGVRDDPADRGVLSFGSWYCASPSCPGKTGSEASEQTWLFSGSPPLVNLSVHASSSAIDNGTSVGFNSTFLGGTPLISFTWNFGDGGSSSVRDANHTYDRAGSYSPTLWVNDSAGDSLSASVPVVVAPTLAVTLTVLPAPTDVDLPTSFAAVLSGGTPPFAYSWQFGDGGASLLSNPSHTFATAGTFHAVVWVNDSGGLSEGGTAVVTVDPALVLGPANATPNPADLGRPVNFSTLASGGTSPYTYSWAFGDGGSGGDLANITHIFTTNGPFIAVATVTDAAGATAHSQVNITITLNASIFSNASIGAAPLVVGFQSEVSGGTPGYTYTWSFGDGGQSGTANPVHTYTSSGSYPASLRVVDSMGQSTSTTWVEQIAVGGGPLSVDVSVSGQEIAVGGSTVVTANPEGGFGRYSLTWSGLPSGCAPTSPESLNCTPTESGSYTVTASVADSKGETARSSATIEVGVTSPGGGLSGPLAPWGAGGLLVGVLLVAVAATSIYVVGARRRPRTTGGPGTQSGRYARYREPAPERAHDPPQPDASATEDSLRDLISARKGRAGASEPSYQPSPGGTIDAGPDQRRGPGHPRHAGDRGS